MVCIFILPLEKYPLNIVSYLILALFLPGYALMGAVFPKKEELKTLKRIIGSIIISNLLTLLLVLITKHFIIGISFSTVFLLIGILTIILSFDAWEGHIRSSKEQEKTIKSHGKIKTYNLPYSNKDKRINTSNKKCNTNEDLFPSYNSDKILFDKQEKHYETRFKSLDLILLFLSTMICIIILFIPKLNDSIIRTIIGILLILFLPGYSLVTAVYPKKNDLKNIERVSLSFSFPLISFALFLLVPNIIPTAIDLTYIFLILSVFTIVMILIAYIRRRRDKKEEKLFENFHENTENLVSKNFESAKESTSQKRSHDLVIERSPNGISKPSYLNMDLLLIFLTTIIAIIFIITPKLNETFMKTILEFSLILFLPGYSLIATLFLKRNDIDIIERISLSLGISIVVTLMFSLVFYLTSWGVKLTPILISLSIFTIVFIFVAFIRRRNIPKYEKFYLNFDGFFKSLQTLFNEESKINIILSIFLTLSVLLAIFTTVYIVAKPKQGETFTEFYILGPGGTASDYPTNLTIGQNGSVIIGIVNHEYQDVNYDLVITTNGTIISEQNVTLSHNNKIEIPCNFSLNTQGINKIEFLLYKLPDKTNVYRSLHIFVNVT